MYVIREEPGIPGPVKNDLVVIGFLQQFLPEVQSALFPSKAVP